MSRLQKILSQAGVPDQGTFVQASGGQRNETWLCSFSRSEQAYVVRLAIDSDQHALEHEAALLQHLAGTIPVPTVIAHGRDGHGEWMIQEKVVGTSLAHAWPMLTERTRRAAVAQLANIVQTLHQLSCDVFSPLPSPRFLPPDWLSSVLPSAVRQLAEKSKGLRYVDPLLMNDVVRYIEASDGRELASDTWGIIHGDLHFDNILWDGRQIAALLDFEKACYAPLDLELDLLLRYCTFPALFVAEEFEHLTQAKEYRLVPTWFRQTYPQLFDVPYLRQRLGLYSLLYDLTLLQRFPPRSEVDLHEEDHLLNRIRAVTADGIEI